MIFKPIKFYKRAANFLAFYRQIKLIRCPHCQKSSYLILHGYLSGYDEKSNRLKTIRGHRVFCSNRDRRQGCGRTFSVLAAHILKNYTITTQSLWNFLNNIVLGMNKRAAFGLLQLPFSLSSIYRLYQRIYIRQQRIRTLLLKYSPPPINVPSNNPLIKTILHIKSTFARDANPLAVFQGHFQTSLL